MVCKLCLKKMKVWANLNKYASRIIILEKEFKAKIISKRPFQVDKILIAELKESHTLKV